MKGLWAFLPVAAIVGIVAVSKPNEERQLQIMGGRSAISFHPSILATNGLRLKNSPTAEGDESTGEASTGFRISVSDLKFTLIKGKLANFQGGSISHDGGFALS